MPWPDDNLVNPDDYSLWGDEFRALGGRTYQDAYADEEAFRAQRYDSYGMPPPDVQPPQQQWMDPSQFVTWDKYQEMVGGRLEPYDAYDKYINSLAPSQLAQMGYSADEINEARRAFVQANPPPERDLGFFGNLYQSLTSGYQAGTRAVGVAGSAITDNLDSIVRSVGEQAQDRPVAPRAAYANAQDYKGDSYYEGAKNILSAMVSHPEGLTNEFIYQLGQNYPTMVAGLAGMFSPVPGGAEAATAVSSFAVDDGAEFMNNTIEAAQKRRVDINDPVALKRMLQDPEVFREINNAAAAHGFGTSAMSTAGAAFSLGLTKVIAKTVKAGRPLRAAGLTAGGLGGEVLFEGGGEALGTALAGKEQNVGENIAEGFLGIGPSVVMGGANYLRELVPSQTTGTPGTADVGGDLDETDLPGGYGDQFIGPPDPFVGPRLPPFVGPELPRMGGFGVSVDEQGPVEEINIGVPPGPPQYEDFVNAEPITIGDVPGPPPTYDVTEMPTDAGGGPPDDGPGGGAGIEVGQPTVEEINVQDVVDTAERRIAEGRLLPPPANFVAGPGGVQAQGQAIAQQVAQRTQQATQERRANTLLNRTPADAPLNTLVNRQIDAGRIPASDADRLRYLTTAQPVDLNKKLHVDNLVAWMRDRGVALTSERHVEIIEDLIGTPPNDRQAYIANMIDELASSPNPRDTLLAEGLIVLGEQLPKERLTPAQAAARLEAALPGTPLAEVNDVAAEGLARDAVEHVPTEEELNESAKRNFPLAPNVRTNYGTTTLGPARRRVGTGLAAAADERADERAEAPQGGPGGGLRAGEPTQGTGASGSARPTTGAKGSLDSKSQGSAAAKSVGPASATGVHGAVAANDPNNPLTNRYPRSGGLGLASTTREVADVLGDKPLTEKQMEPKAPRKGRGKAAPPVEPGSVESAEQMTKSEMDRLAAEANAREREAVRSRGLKNRTELSQLQDDALSMSEDQFNAAHPDADYAAVVGSIVEISERASLTRLQADAMAMDEARFNELHPESDYRSVISSITVATGDTIRKTRKKKNALANKAKEVQGGRYGGTKSADVANQEAIDAQRQAAQASQETGGLSPKQKRGLKNRNKTENKEEKPLVDQSRRGFLKQLGALAVAAVSPKLARAAGSLEFRALLAKDGATVQDALRHIIANEPKLAPIASKVLAALGSRPFPISFYGPPPKGASYTLRGRVARNMRTKDMVLQIYDDNDPKASGANPYTVLHEAIHAAVAERGMHLDAMSPGALGDQLHSIRRSIAAYYKSMPENVRKDLESKFKNDMFLISEPLESNGEFLSYAMTSQPFQNWLRSIPSQGGRSNVLSDLKNWIMRLFGIGNTPAERTAFDDAFEAGHAILDSLPGRDAVGHKFVESTGSKMRRKFLGAGAKDATTDWTQFDRMVADSESFEKKNARESTDADDYKETYPGRDLHADTESLFSESDDARWQGQTPLSPAAQRTIESASFSDVMNYLGSVMATPLDRQVAAAIEALGIDIPIRLGQLDGTKRGEYTPPSMLPGRKANVGITIDPRKATLETVLHEAVHAATTTALRFPRTTEQRAAGERVRELFAFVEQQPGAQKFYGVNQERGKPGTVEEFVAEAFSNPQFQKFLNNIKLPGAPKETAWTAFKQFVMDLIGRPTVLSETLKAGSDLFSPEQRAGQPLSSNSPPANNGKANSVPRDAITGVKAGVRTFIAYAKTRGDPNTKYTLYPVSAQFYRGDPAGKMPGLTRDQVEQHIRGNGSETIAPATDTSVKSGTPKNSSTRRVGFDNEGNLKSAAFEQKDGTWTYYESDDDVRTDPDARVVKGLSQSTAERYISARGLNPEPPKGGAVQTAGKAPTQVAYDPAHTFWRWFQDKEATLLNIGKVAGGEDLDTAAVLRNSRFQKKWRDVQQQYIQPLAKTGANLMERFGKTEPQIWELMQSLHVIERMKVKQQQFYRGNLQGAELQKKQNQLKADQQAAEDEVRKARAANPAFVAAVEQEFAPKVKAMANNSIDMSAQYGLIPRDEAEEIKRAYDFYVPLQTGDKTTIGKAATGSATSGDMSFARLIEQSQRTIARGEQNRVRQEVFKLAKSLYNKATKSNPISLANDRHKITYNKETNSLNFGPDSLTFDKDSVDVYVNGERIRMKIEDESLLEALNPYQGEQRKTALTAGIAAMAQINRLISMGKTSLNPAWPPFNFARDILTANLNLPAGVSRARYLRELVSPSNYAAVFANVAKEALFKQMPTGLYAEAKDAGALIDHRAYIGLDPVAKGTGAMFKPPAWKSAKEFASFDGQLFDILSILAQTAESVPRVAMYRAALASPAFKGNKERAAVAAKNASVNFERRGSTNIGAWWIFANAKMQGIHALMRTVERQGMVKSGAGALGIVALGALAASLGYEWSEKDKDGKSKYAKIPDQKKDSMILFKEGAFGIPFPQEIAPLYILGNAVQEARMGGNTLGKATARVFTGLLNNAWPGSVAQQDPVGHKADMFDFVTRMFVPSVASPLFDSATNKNTFGQEVVSNRDKKREQGIPAHEMGSPNENQLAVSVARGLANATGGLVDIAPQQLKLWHNFFDPATEGYAAMRDLFGGREEKYVGDIVNPFARKFTGKATEFYDQTEFDELLASAKHAQYKIDTKNPQRVPIDQLSPQEQLLARQADMLKRVDSDVNNLFKGYQLMTPEKRKLLNERKRELILSGMRRYNEARDRSAPQR